MPLTSIASALGACPPHVVLDPRSLGRPVHRLAAFAARFEDELNSHWAEPLNRRYTAGLRVTGLAFSRDEAPLPPGRWLAFRSACGGLGWQLSREAALCLLAYRYGLAQPPVAESTDALRQAAAAAVPETASEERLVRQMGAQVLGLLAHGLSHAAGDETAPAEPLPDFDCLGVAVPDARDWRLCGELRDSRSGCIAPLAITLDARCMAQLFKTLDAGREGRGARAERLRSGAEAARAFPHRLGLTLTARLLQKELPLGTLLDLRVGDVLPVRLGTTDVLIDEARLFTATVAERQGKLCLTTFEDAE